MRFRFNDEKTAQAAAYLLRLHGKPMPYLTLIKLLYLADRSMLLTTGQPITGDRLFSMRHGPVLSRVYEFISDGPDDSSAWFKYVDAPSNYCVRAKGEAPTGEMSKFEMRLLEELHAKYGEMDRWALVKLLHDILPEWNDPGETSKQIYPEDILRAESRSEDEIRRINDDSKEAWLMDATSLEQANVLFSLVPSENK